MNLSPKILLTTSFLNFAGGYERIMVETANLFSRKGLQITLLILGDTIESFYPIDKEVKVLQFPVHFGITKRGNTISRKMKMISDLISFKKILKQTKADVVIGTEYHFSVGAILCGGKKYSKIISWEHTHYYGTKRNFFWRQLFQLTYPKLHAIVCLNEEEQSYFSKLAATTIIPNFSDNKSGRIAQAGVKKILSVGSLIPRKGIDFLLIAAKKILADHPDWTWKLIGSGELERSVLDFIKLENLEGRFILQDSLSSNLDDEYASASLFVLSSRSETLPMVLIEAMSFGLPCVSFDCPSGPSAIINNGENGFLVEKENPEKLAASVSKLIADNELRKKMSEGAIENAKHFSSDHIYSLWQQLFELLEIKSK